MLFVSDIMTRWVATVDPKRTVRDAATIMTKAHTGSIIIMDKEKPVGIVTEGDISRALARGADADKVSIGKIMSKKLITVSPDLMVEEAAKLMAEKRIKKLPVLEGGGLVGIVTQTDIVASSFDLVTSLKEMVRVRRRPPDFQP
jgi:CBS domain-containing protein